MVGLEFVSISHPDDIKRRENRKKIGQHVMKEIGYARRKTPRKKKVSEAQPRGSPKRDTAVQVKALSKAIRSDAQASFDTSDGFQKSPITILSRNYAARSANIQTLLTKKSSPMCTKQRELYYTVAMMDDGALQLALADAALLELSQTVGRFNVVQENPQAMRHYTACIANLNHRIRQREAVSQHMLSIIIGLASYDFAIRNFERWGTHMKGLENLVRTRGGLMSLSSTYVANSLVWTDLCGSLSIDARPHFHIDEHKVETDEESSIPSIPLSLALLRICGILENRSSVYTDLCTLLLSLSNLASRASSKPSGEWVDDKRLVKMISQTGHRALTLPRHNQLPGPESDSSLFEAVRLAAILFIIGPLCSLSGEHDIMLSQVGRLPALLKSQIIDWGGLEELRLWVYTLGARIEEGKDREWFVEDISKYLKGLKMDLKSLDQVLHDIAWVDEALEQETGLLKAEILSVW